MESDHYAFIQFFIGLMMTFLFFVICLFLSKNYVISIVLSGIILVSYYAFLILGTSVKESPAKPLENLEDEQKKLLEKKIKITKILLACWSCFFVFCLMWFLVNGDGLWLVLTIIALLLLIAFIFCLYRLLKATHTEKEKMFQLKNVPKKKRNAN